MKLRSSPLILTKVKKKDNMTLIGFMTYLWSYKQMGIFFEQVLTLLDVELGWKKGEEKKGGGGGGPEVPATPTQTSWAEGEGGFTHCRIGYKEESAGFWLRRSC